MSTDSNDEDDSEVNDISDILDDILNNSNKDESSEEDESHIEDLSRDEICRKAIREGRVKIDDERAVIRCPQSESSAKFIRGGDHLTDSVNKYYACPLFPAPDPDNPGEMKMVCGGPERSMVEYERHDHQEMGSGRAAFNGCPYSAKRL